MKKLILSAFVVGSLISAPASFVGPAGAIQCPDTVPDAWKRQGGYCSQIGGSGGSGGTITDKSGGDEIIVPPAVECVPISYRLLRKGDRLIIADVGPCDDLCGAVELDLEGMAPGDRLRVAGC